MLYSCRMSFRFGRPPMIGLLCHAGPMTAWKNVLRAPGSVTHGQLPGGLCWRATVNFLAELGPCLHIDRSLCCHAGAAAARRAPCRRHAQQRMARCSLKSSAGWLAAIVWSNVQPWCHVDGMLSCHAGAAAAKRAPRSAAPSQCAAGRGTWTQCDSVMQGPGRLLRGEDAHGTGLGANGQHQPTGLWCAAASRKAGCITATCQKQYTKR